MNRRDFITTMGAGVCLPNLLMANTNNLQTTSSISKVILEDAKKIPVVDNFDVAVCGAGPAGVSAAIAAARAGAKTCLIEVHGCLGGIWTAGQLAWIFDMDKPGITREITSGLDRLGARRNTELSHYAYEIEAMKLLLEQMCLNSGVQIRLHTRVVASILGKEKQLKAVITESKSGREAWNAKVFIDATGDGDLAARSGCGFDLGSPDTAQVQPMTLMALVAVENTSALSDYISMLPGGAPHPICSKRFLSEIKRAGITPSYGNPTLFHVRDNILSVMVNHQYGFSALNASDLTKATLEARAEINKVVLALRKLDGPWKNIQLVTTAEQIGIREGRRIHGRYCVSVSDTQTGKQHEDGICNVTFAIDVHSLTGVNNEILDVPETLKDKQIVSDNGSGLTAFSVQPYQIPLRALISRDIDNLMMAGRCISGDWLAHASYRVTGNAVATGQAAGVTAAMAACKKTQPYKLNWKDIKKQMEQLHL